MPTNIIVVNNNSINRKVVKVRSFFVLLAIVMNFMLSSTFAFVAKFPVRSLVTTATRKYFYNNIKPTKLLSTTTPVYESNVSAPGPPKGFTPKPFQYHQELTIRIDSLTNMGWGVGRVKLEEEEEEAADNTNKNDDNNNNLQTPSSSSSSSSPPSRLWVIMVPHVIINELVKVRIFRNRKSFSEADLIEVIEPSEHRVEPKCSLAGVCGGCQYQHMSIVAQREWKLKHVQDVLHQNKVEYDPTVLHPTLGTDHVYGYRSKITPHYEAPKVIPIAPENDNNNDNAEATTVMDTENQNEIPMNNVRYVMSEIGFQKSTNRQTLNVQHCPIATDAINDEYAKIYNALHEQAAQGLLNQEKKKKKKKRRRGSKNNNGVAGATLLLRQADNDKHGNPVVVTDNNEYMTTTVNNIKFRYLAGNFFQNNNFVLPLMVDLVVQAATKPITNDQTIIQPTHLIDCYCGSGLFAISAASKFDLCVGIEVNDRAVEEAKTNAQQNGIYNCKFIAASAEAIFDNPKETNDGTSNENQERILVQDFPRESTIVVVDPPRKGCSTEFLEQLYDYSPQRIVYMSCDPSTQARDAKGITEIGGYKITSIQPIDLFPQTRHIECLVIFDKK